jgi:betaine-aldehyde dehydrogenase
VVKPSEVAPLTAIALTEAIDTVGIPHGVFNLVHGIGPVVGEAIAAHPAIDMLSFTGSGAVGKRVAAVAADTVKRVSLELGGKSASVILDDSDLAVAVKGTMRSSFMNGGQSCNALTRMLVPRPLLVDAEQLARCVAEGYTTGDPMDDATKLGPIVSATQRDRVVSYIRTGIAEGARLVAGGETAQGSPAGGFFVAATVFSDVAPHMTIAQEEIFGPVLSIIPYDDVDEAVEIANGTVYGIAGAVWSGNAERAQSVARRLRAAQIEVNGGQFNPSAPFGGYKQSGLGREGGRFGIEEFLELKSLQL